MPQPETPRLREALRLWIEEDPELTEWLWKCIRESLDDPRQSVPMEKVFARLKRRPARGAKSE
jgi:hypothetical protein